MTKDNIMKHTDGLFHDVFNEVAKEYPDIESDHYIIDIGSALLAAQPDRFDVVVTLNLYGDIISDITAQVAGSVGLGGSANIGDGFAMFEAIHGSAPDIAGKNIANPSGLIQAACMMLVHLRKPEIAERIMNALLTTLEDGIHTADVYSEAYTRVKAGTREFASAVIERLGRRPSRLHPVSYGQASGIDIKPLSEKPPVIKRLVGADLFLDWTDEGRDANVLGAILDGVAGPDLKLKMITNRGVKVYPNGLPETFCTDHWRCRFVDAQTTSDQMPDVTNQQLIDLQQRLIDKGLDIIKTENLYEFDGIRGFSLGQGE